MAESGLCSKRKIHSSHTFKSVTLHEFEGHNVDGAHVLEGFPSTSLTSIIVANYICEQLQLPLIGEIISAEFPAHCVVENFVPSAAMRIHGNEQLVIFLCEFKLVDGPLVHEVTEALLDFCERHHCPHLLTVEGISRDMVERDLKERQKEREKEKEKEKFKKDLLRESKIPIMRELKEKDKEFSSQEEAKENSKELSEISEGPEKTSNMNNDNDNFSKNLDNLDLNHLTAPQEISKLLFYLTNSAEFDRTMKLKNHLPLKSGVIEGVTGLLLTKMCHVTDNNLVISCLLVPTSMQYPDAQGAVTVVTTITEIIRGLQIDLKPLVEKANILEKAITQLRNEMRNQQLGISNDPLKTSMYN